MALIGAWHAEPEADREIVAYVADRKYETIEDDVARLLRFDDSPVWSAGRYRGVVSKIDALFAIARMITPADLDRFFDAAEYVLSESDPALELPEEKRWAAALYGKKRDHSGALREGICETLVILSVHGNNLFQSRLGIDVESRVAVLIRKLLTPLTLEKLLSHDHDLPRYAEAAPDEFLKIIEEDLRRNDPVVFGLLKPVDSGSTLGIAVADGTSLGAGVPCLETAKPPACIGDPCPALPAEDRRQLGEQTGRQPSGHLQVMDAADGGLGGAEGQGAGDAHQAFPGCRLGDLHRADQTGFQDRPSQLQAPLAQRRLRSRAGRHAQRDVRLQPKGSGLPDRLAVPRRKDSWRSRRVSPGYARGRPVQGLGPDR